jgi:hypothetical protein
VAERGTPARAAEAGVAEPGSVDYIDAAVAGSRPAPSDEERAELGGASDLFVPGGASDVFRR